MKRAVRLSFLIIVVSFGTFLGGCNLVAKPADMNTESPNVTIKGVISAINKIYSISDGIKSTELVSNSLDLGQYVGKTVTVIGQFSGTTLYVDLVNLE